MLQRDVEGFCYPNGSRVDLDHGVTEMVQRSGLPARDGGISRL